MKNKFNKNILKWILVLIVILQPLVELDYLAYDFLNQFGIPRLSTLVRFIVIPIIIIWGFVVFDKNKKRTLLFTFLYGGSGIIYFVMHCMNAIKIREDLYLPGNFYFSVFQELTYVLTLILPFFFIYVVFEAKLKDKMIKYTVLGMSALISVPILLSNIFVFGQSTYLGYTKAPFYTWFFGIYEQFHPREMASKFFFVEGNTMGIVLFILLPIVYFYFYKSKTTKQKLIIGSLIFIQSLSMIILSTRIATYGSIIAAVSFLFIMLFSSLIMKNANFSKTTTIFVIVMIIICGSILPYSPSVVNQRIDNTNDKVVLEDNYMIDEGKAGVEQEIAGAKTKYDPALVYAFQQYGIKSNLMSTVPTMYYMEWYKYTHDAWWWLDLLFNVPFYERVNGRQIQTLFIKYKWSETPNPSVDYALGLGYSTIMNGSLILERDFVQQFYSFGYVGWLLLIGPWIGVTLYGVYKVLRNPKKNMNPEILTFACALCFGFIGAYSSGHTLDQFSSSLLLAFIVANLLRLIGKENV